MYLRFAKNGYVREWVCLKSFTDLDVLHVVHDSEIVIMCKCCRQSNVIAEMGNLLNHVTIY